MFKEVQAHDFTKEHAGVLHEILRLPDGKGRILYTEDTGEATRYGANAIFSSSLIAEVRHNGKLEDQIDLGSGLVTNVGVTALANDFAWAQNCQTLKLANWHAVGTGSNAAATTDLSLQTLGAPTTTSAVAGTQSLVSAANAQVYKTSGVINFTTSVAVAEWGLHTAQTLSATTGTPFTGTSATTATVTGTPYTASSAAVQGEQQLIVLPGTTTVYGLILSNTTSVLTIPAWYKVADGTAGSTPGTTEAFTLKPVLFDRRQFSVINVGNGDSITWNYSLTLNSGG